MVAVAVWYDNDVTGRDDPFSKFCWVFFQFLCFTVAFIVCWCSSCM